MEISDEIILIHEKLWDCVETEDTSGDTKKRLKSQKALAKIALAVNPAAIPHLRNATTAHQVWSQLQKAYEDKAVPEAWITENVI